MTTAKFYDILYIQSEEKQGYLHSLRSVSPHRYLRYISWISWNFGSRRSPRYHLSTSWGFHPAQPYANPPTQRLPRPAHLHDRPRTPQSRGIYIPFLPWQGK
nr:MAG TPA: hypothetical protein [Caudoviricetes sp.]